MASSSLSEPIPIRRSFAAELEAGDGRTVIGRCVPYGSPTLVCDPGGEPYLEAWTRGAFRSVLKAPNRVLFNFEHGAGLGDQIGAAVELTDSDEGLDGVFRATDDETGRHALELIRTGAYRGLSIHALIPPHGSRIAPDGTVIRTRATLRHVALTATPAFADAQVLATRSSGELAAAPVSIAAIRAQQSELRLRFAKTK